MKRRPMAGQKEFSFNHTCHGVVRVFALRLLFLFSCLFCGLSVIFL
jgi:hypothetical protein